MGTDRFWILMVSTYPFIEFLLDKSTFLKG